MENKSSGIFRLEGDDIGYPSNHEDAMLASIMSMRESNDAALEYMNMTGHLGKESIERFENSVVEQDKLIKATSEAITSLQTRVSDGLMHINHCDQYKVMDVYKPYEIVMRNSSYTVNTRYLGVSELDENNFRSILDTFNTYTPIGLSGFANPIPVWYEFLGKTFAVWDKGSEDLVCIFRRLYELRNPEDFRCFCMSLGYTCKTVFGYGCNVLDGDTVIYPKRVRGKFVNVLGDTNRTDRLPKSVLKVERPFFNSIDMREDSGLEFEEPLPVDFIDYSYAKVMKAKRDGGTWDERTLTCGTIVRTMSEPKPKLTIAEEIEQRLIEKYLK